MTAATGLTATDPLGMPVTARSRPAALYSYSCGPFGVLSHTSRPLPPYSHSETDAGVAGAEASVSPALSVVAAETICPTVSYSYRVTVPVQVRPVIRPSPSRPISVTSACPGSCCQHGWGTDRYPARNAMPTSGSRSGGGDDTPRRVVHERCFSQQGVVDGGDPGSGYLKRPGSGHKNLLPSEVRPMDLPKADRRMKPSVAPAAHKIKYDQGGTLCLARLRLQAQYPRA